MAETKFKYNDKVKVIGTNTYGELIDIKPQGISPDKQLVYLYVLFSFGKVYYVREHHLEKIERYPYEE